MITTKWLSHSSRVHQIRFRPGLRPGSRWGAYSAPPGPLAGLRGPTFKGRERDRGKGQRKGGKGEGNRGMERKGRVGEENISKDDITLQHIAKMSLC